MVTPGLTTDKLIGSGAMGSVYLAHDPAGKSYALKVLRTEAASLSDMFESEVGILSKLKHPRLVEIEGFSKGGAGVEGAGGEPCFWMEFIEGEPILKAALQAKPAQILEWFRECLEALEYLHTQGILHGDLKPANVMVQGKSHIKLVDFGLATLTQSLTKSPTKAQGSIPYLAPEVLQGEKLPAGDLFSLGTIFYQALAGAHPRAKAKNIKDLFSKDVPKLSEKNPAVPSHMGRVIDRMIEPDLSRRLKSARDALEALTQEKPIPKETDESFHSFKMLGIDPLWERFFSFWEKIKQAKGHGIVLVHGMTGVGKTRFIRELFFECSLQGLNVSQSSVQPQGPLLVSTFGPEGESEAEGIIQIVPAAEKLGPGQLKELYQFLSSTEVVPGLVILEFNDENLTPHFQNAFSALTLEKNVLDLQLKNLSRKDTRQFLETGLRTRLPYEIVQELFDRTQGNPKLLTETCREILQWEILKKKHLTLNLFQEISLPKTAQEIFEKRLKDLQEDERKFLTLLAVAPGAIPLDQMMSLGGVGLAKARGFLQKYLRLGLVQDVPEAAQEAYKIAHPTLAELILGNLADSQREELHQRWIKELEKDLDEKKEIPPQQALALAHHVVGVRTHPQQVDWVLEAGNVLASQEDYESALKLYHKCLAHDLPTEKRETLLRTLINAYGKMGRFKESNEWLEKWFSEYGEDPLGINPVKYWLSSAVSYQNQGNAQEARHRFMESLKVADPKNEHHRPFIARAYSLLGLLDTQEKKFPQALTHFGQALKLLREPSAQKAEVFKHQAQWAVQQDNWDEALKFLAEARKMYEELKNPAGLFSTALEKGNLALRLGKIHEVEQAYGEALKIARQNKDEASLARIYQNLGVLNCRIGNYGRAVEELEKAREIFSFLGSPQDRNINFSQLALAYTALGRFKQGEEILALPRQQVDLSNDIRERLEEVEYQIPTIRYGLPAADQKNPFDFLGTLPEWDLEKRLLKITGDRDLQESIDAEKILLEMYQKLSDPLKIGFEDRGDYRRWVLKEKVSVPKGAKAKGSKLERELRENEAMDILQKVSVIMKEILSSKKIDDVLIRLMDAAMEFSRAERGFLVLKGDSEKGPLAGFEVMVARNLAKEQIEREESALSLSAVREAMDKGEVMVTDNALQDVRFETAKSVHQLELKSILALPLKGTSGIIGALYLDHTYQTDIFQSADLNILQILADQAALALQKAQLVEELKQANAQLENQVEVQASELDVLKREVEDQRQQLQHEYKDIIGHSPAMLEVLSLVDRVTETKVPVWIYGESGTGKEMIAHALHFNSSRSKKPFVSENCSALPETLLESELFGHKKGAFTHADRDKKGLLEYANTGTVFLDEIADMSPAMQAKLLRFLQEGEIRPVGSNQMIKVDVRVVSASNKYLPQLVQEEKFREDLFYRLNGVTIPLPALRERMEDLPVLAQHFLKKIAKEEGKGAFEIAPDALEMLMEYQWPGNVRELENTLRTASLFHHRGKLTLKSFNFKKSLLEKGTAPPSRTVAGKRAKGVGAAPGEPGGMPDEKRLLLQALYDAGFHKGHAAKALGISRRYLYTQLLRHSVPVNRIEMKSYIEEQLGKK